MGNIDYENCHDWRIIFDNPSNMTELKKRYRIVAKKYHPDSYKNDRAFVNISKRYEDAIKYFEICNGSVSNTNVLEVRDKFGKGFDLQYIRKDEMGGNIVYTSK